MARESVVEPPLPEEAPVAPDVWEDPEAEVLGPPQAARLSAPSARITIAPRRAWHKTPEAEHRITLQSPCRNQECKSNAETVRITTAQ